MESICAFFHQLPIPWWMFTKRDAKHRPGKWTVSESAMPQSRTVLLEWQLTRFRRGQRLWPVKRVEIKDLTGLWNMCKSIKILCPVYYFLFFNTLATHLCDEWFESQTWQWENGGLPMVLNAECWPTSLCSFPPLLTHCGMT